ncbi:uncharacterized protein ACA1_213210 [Acanthamoeba castellanii str. Neff]|uniref:Uncharacterized protein n=1 Tax=Acanthamoeba castellanii (strain ATCC 30010 / Neff) TaxID=1257118 RepID=L8GPE1_ACACF|nr:uncharacterized protein ACA1_213210 [Acanthamoeba castellanii str. Neff]ELR15034.1 hypothetical protein ACA1_213210 [Acanthamoeba castellanii str. Neff]
MVPLSQQRPQPVNHQPPPAAAAYNPFHGPHQAQAPSHQPQHQPLRPSDAAQSRADGQASALHPFFDQLLPAPAPGGSSATAAGSAHSHCLPITEQTHAFALALAGRLVSAADGAIAGAHASPTRALAGSCAAATAAADGRNSATTAAATAIAVLRTTTDEPAPAPAPSSAPAPPPESPTSASA